MGTRKAAGISVDDMCIICCEKLIESEGGSGKSSEVEGEAESKKDSNGNPTQQALFLLPCKHCFHESCMLESWAKSQYGVSCPLCREKLRRPYLGLSETDEKITK